MKKINVKANAAAVKAKMSKDRIKQMRFYKYLIKNALAISGVAIAFVVGLALSVTYIQEYDSVNSDYKTHKEFNAIIENWEVNFQGPYSQKITELKEKGIDEKKIVAYLKRHDGREFVSLLEKLNGEDYELILAFAQFGADIVKTEEGKYFGAGLFSDETNTMPVGSFYQHYGITENIENGAMKRSLFIREWISTVIVPVLIALMVYLSILFGWKVEKPVLDEEMEEELRPRWVGIAERINKGEEDPLSFSSNMGG